MKPELDTLLLAQADAALVLVEPRSGRVLHSNPVWAQWLQQPLAATESWPLWHPMLWQQPESLRTLVSLAGWSLALPAMPVTALTGQGRPLPLLLSAKVVRTEAGRHVLCTLVNDPQAPTRGADSPSVQALRALVQTLGGVLEQHDPASAGHQRRVADLVTTLARRLGWPPAEVDSLELAAWLHDLGMVGVPAAVLTQQSLLTREEVRLIQQHVDAAVRMLEHIDFPGPVTALIAQHHERINGSGYPAGLRGDAVLRGAQLIGMADMLDAMTRERPYQSAQPMDQALGTLLAGAGILFDADLVQACVRLFVDEGYRFPDA